MSLEGPRRGAGARAPLFDRLFDFEPREHEETHPRRVHGWTAVVDSIRVELSRLLNTRCAVSLDGLREQPRTVVNYGLPDFTTLSPTSDRDRERLAVLIAEAVGAYEPRLRTPRVVVAVDPERPRALRLALHATLTLEGLTEPVSFPLQIESAGGPIVVDLPVDDVSPPKAQG